LQTGYARLQNPTKKKFPFPLRLARGEGARGQKLILNLQQSPGNLAFFSPWLNSYYVSRDYDSSLLTAH